VIAELPGESQPEVIRPPHNACCAGCGVVLGDEWVSYRQDPDSPEAVLQDFSQVVQWETRRGQRGAALAGTFKGFPGQRESTALVSFATQTISGFSSIPRAHQN
jgi:hypothetical protein